MSRIKIEVYAADNGATLHKIGDMSESVVCKVYKFKDKNISELIDMLWDILGFLEISKRQDLRDKLLIAEWKGGAPKMFSAEIIQEGEGS